jgi:hypothetical protein
MTGSLTLRGEWRQAMSLTPESLNAIAKRKARRAQQHVEAAEAQLKDANARLGKAIPSGDTGEMRVAQSRTQQAEQAVSKAAEELELVGELLDPVPEVNPPENHTGEGVKSLLRRPRK